jgi:2-oxoglutarate ferredoxin oxidoreductase subunit alpha
MPESVEVVDRKGPDVPPAEYRPYRHTEDKVPPMAAYGRDGYRFHVTGLVHDETGFPSNNPEVIEKLALRLHAKLERHRDEVVDVERVACDDAEIGIFAYGATSRSACQTVREARAAGIKVGLLRPRTLWPFPDREVRAFAGQVRTIIVPELNLGQMAHEVEWAAAGACPIDPLMRIDGQPISPRQILARVDRAAKGDH